MKKNEPHEVYVESVNLNFSKVDIYMGVDGTVFTDFKKDGSIKLCLDIEEKEWGVMVSDLIHELMETFLLKTGCRYARTDLPEGMEAITCTFILGHDNFQQACQEVGFAVVKVLPKLFKVFEEQNKRRLNK